MLSQGLPNSGDKMYLIGFEPFVQPGNEAYVHHYIVYGFATSGCPQGNERFFGETVFVWAPGSEAWALPDFLGVPFNGADEFNSFIVEVHYNNIQRTAGVRDSSGVRLYWTSQARDVEMGIFSTGDVQLALLARRVGDGLSKHEFACPSSCSETVLQEQAVTVVREYLHMHQTGVRITSEQMREGEVIHTGALDFWDFDQNGNAEVVQDAFVVEPGDSFRTTCYYDATAETRFGLGSQQEMCMVFMAYYPRVRMQISTKDIFGVDFGVLQTPWVCGYDLPVPFCNAAYERSILAGVDEVGYNFGVTAEFCPEPEESLSSRDDDDEIEIFPNDDETDDAVGSYATQNTQFMVGGITCMFAGLLFF